MKNSLMIYGANGYSAGLILEKLLERNITPVLAGRNRYSITPIAEEYKCEHRIFNLNDESVISSNLKDIHTLLNCAGPFRYTAKSLLAPCVKTGTNYLDITGEIEAIENAWSFDEQAKNVGITIIPSVGFDVIPTDCLAKKLYDKMPDADFLKLGILTNGKLSRGTWLITIEMMGEKGKVRRNGKIVDSDIGEFEIKLSLDNNVSFKGVSIPWGDVSSAYYSTGISNIDVYLGLTPAAWRFRNSLKIIINSLINKSVNRFIQKLISSFVTGPSEQQRNKTETIMWGTVSNNKGNELTEAYQTMEGYNLTALGASEASIRVLNGEVEPGTKTPSMAFGSEFMDEYVIRKIK